MHAPPIRIVLRRGDIPESEHLADAVVTNAQGNITAAWGDPHRITSLRSSAKPLQAAPLFDLPQLQDLHISEEMWAVCCASHDGGPRCAALAAAVLSITGFCPDDLVCGAPAGAASPLSHGCSGNHAAILLLAYLHGWPLEGYHRPEHPVQHLLGASVARLSGADRVLWGMDGCGIPTFGVTLAQAAAAFGRLTMSGQPAAPLVRAMTTFPELVGKAEYPDVQLMQATGGAFCAKTGAEGLVTIGRDGMGFAIKVRDGNGRADGPAALRLLHRLGWITDEQYTSDAAAGLRSGLLQGSPEAPEAQLEVVLP